MNRIVCGIKALVARMIARRMEVRLRRFRRSLRDEHRGAMRYLQDASRRIRGLRLYAAWSNPKRAAALSRPAILLGYSMATPSDVEEMPPFICLPYRIKAATPDADANLMNRRPAVAVKVCAEFNERMVLIDLNELESIESGSAAVLIEGMSLIAARGGNLAVFGAREDVRHFFRTTRLDEIVPIFSTREEALADRTG